MTKRTEMASHTGMRRTDDRTDDLPGTGGGTTGPHALTNEERDAFLDALAQTCNVKSAAGTAARSMSTFYALRRRDPQFAEQWLAALTVGYETVEARLIDYALGRSFDPDTIVDNCDVDAAAAPMLIPGTGLGSGRTPTIVAVPPDIQVGLLLLARHRATLDGGKPLRRGRRVATAAETDAVLNKRLDQLARSLGQRR